MNLHSSTFHSLGLNLCYIPSKSSSKDITSESLKKERIGSVEIIFQKKTSP